MGIILLILRFKSIFSFTNNPLGSVMKIRVIAILFIIMPFFTVAQTTAPKYSNEFLSIGVGARALGMSNVQVGITNDVTSGYWNPAGLLQIKTKYEAALMHAEYFAGIAKYDYGAVATRLDSSSVIGLSVIRFGVDDIPDTRYLFDNSGNVNDSTSSLNYSKIRYFSAADYAFLVSFAKKDLFVKGLSFGANFKIIHRIVGNFANSWGIGLDAGIQYVQKGWQLGLMARDVTGTFNAWSHNTSMVKDVYGQTGNAVPSNSLEVTLPKLIAGIGRSYRFKQDKFGVLAAADFDFTFDGKRNVVIKSKVASIDPHIGIETDYKRTVYLRGGIGNIQKIKDWDNKSYTSVQPNLGIGVRIKSVYIDYALTNISSLSGGLYSNVFSLRAAIK